jgi:hypothetical protein
LYKLFEKKKEMSDQKREEQIAAGIIFLFSSSVLVIFTCFSLGRHVISSSERGNFLRNLFFSSSSCTIVFLFLLIICFTGFGILLLLGK